jgi:hypothetical protein
MGIENAWRYPTARTAVDAARVDVEIALGIAR